MKTADCSSCGAPILWAVSNTSGKNIPLDAAPIPVLDAPARGLFVLVKRLEDAPLAWPVSPDGPGLQTFHTRQVALYQTHFASCDHPEQHRKR